MRNETLSYTIHSCWILKRLNQLRALGPRIVDARIDGIMNKLSHSKLPPELYSSSDGVIPLSSQADLHDYQNS